MAEGLGRDARPLSEAAVAFIRPQIPELFPDPESLEENRASTEASIRGAAEMIVAGADPRAVQLPPATSPTDRRASVAVFRSRPSFAATGSGTRPCPT